MAFTRFRPSSWWDMIYPRWSRSTRHGSCKPQPRCRTAASPRIEAQGHLIASDEVAGTVMLPMAAAGPGEECLQTPGLGLRAEDGRVLIDGIGFGSAAGKAGFDFEITSVLGVDDRPPNGLAWPPALVVLDLIVWLQRRRSPSLAPATATAGGA